MLKTKISNVENRITMESNAKPLLKTDQKIVNLGMYRIKKSLLNEGFEVVENPDGKITLVIRVAK